MMRATLDEPGARRKGLGGRLFVPRPGPPALGDDELVALIAEHPHLLQRPFVVRGSRAVLARPVERVEALLR